MRPVGSDVSKWQAVKELDKPHGVNFPKLLEIVDFLMLRAGYAGSAGGAWTDERVHDYMKDLEDMLDKNPKPFTFYWYFRDDVSIMDQANRFSAVVNRYKEVVNLPLVLDAEVFNNSRSVSTQKIKDFQTEVERQTGLKVDILYGRGGQLNAQTEPGLPEVLPYLFVARYDSSLDPQVDEPWIEGGPQEYVEPRDYDEWLFWQYSDNGGGHDWGVVSAGIDKNVFNGTLDELRSFAGLDKPVPPPVDWEVWGTTTAEKKIRIIGPGATALMFFSHDVKWEPQFLSIQGGYKMRAKISLRVNGIELPLRQTTVFSTGFTVVNFQRDFNFVKGDGVIVEVTNPTSAKMTARVKLALEKYGEF